MTTTAYEFVVQLFFRLSSAFFWPVAIALIALFAWAMLDLGALFFAMWRKRSEPATDLRGLARRLASAGPSLRTGMTDVLQGEALSPALRRFWNSVRDNLRDVEVFDDVDLWLDEALRREEIEMTTRLDRSRAFIRIGPMLGLAGTIIPLGPALQALLGGDIATMIDHLVVGFGAVVCGLMLSGVAYYITLVRERWARIDIKDMEDLCELVMRALKRQDGKEAVRHASIRTA
ncbi:MAG: MotA/TolQ/ExbB proton channel family protein [Vicinamibacterales bacterium]